MQILLDCRPIQHLGADNEKIRLVFSAAKALSGGAAVKWLLLADHTFRPGLVPELPGAVILIRRSFPGRAGWKLWYDWQIPRLVKRYAVDALMLTGGVAAADCGVPQYLLMPERADPLCAGRAAHYPSIYRGRLRTSLERASMIFCFSDRDRSWLKEHSPVVEDKILLLSAAPDLADPLSMAEKEAVKESYVRGREYFLAGIAGAGEETVMNMLKAFSLFKKRQRSNMQLVLTGKPAFPADGLRKRLETYKYRQDLLWREQLPPEEALRLAAAAYAAVLLVDCSILGVPLLNAWAAAVPAIVAKDGPLADMADGAALLAGNDPASLAARLMLIYKDEHLRGDIIGKGLERVAGYHPGRSVDAVWEGIGKSLRPIA